MQCKGNCRFNQSSASSPCHHFWCVNHPTGGKCGQYWRDYCFGPAGVTDAGCAPLLSFRSEKCPFDRSRSDSPCFAPVCINDGGLLLSTSPSCRRYIRSYCSLPHTVAVGDGGCVTSLQVETVVASCPFTLSAPRTPCLQPACVGWGNHSPDSEACSVEIWDYCASLPAVNGTTDVGCVVPVNATLLSCSFNVTAPQSPCFHQPCWLDPHSLKCLSFVAHYCWNDTRAAGLLDPGCNTSLTNVSAIQVSIAVHACAFSLARVGSPCFAQPCLDNGASRECRRHVAGYCGGRRGTAVGSDSGCLRTGGMEVRVASCPFSNPASPCLETECTTVSGSQVGCNDAIRSFCARDTVLFPRNLSCSDQALKVFSGVGTFLVRCPMQLSCSTPVVGTSTYHASSSICRAAVHAMGSGTFSSLPPGSDFFAEVTLSGKEFLRFNGSSANGITSNSSSSKGVGFTVSVGELSPPQFISPPLFLPQLRVYLLWLHNEALCVQTNIPLVLFCSRGGCLLSFTTVSSLAL